LRLGFLNSRRLNGDKGKDYGPAAQGARMAQATVCSPRAGLVLVHISVIDGY